MVRYHSTINTDYIYLLRCHQQSGFPSVAHSMTTYDAQYPAILQQSLDTLFPFLENMRDYLAKTHPAYPFSGAAKGPSHQPKTRTTRGHAYQEGQQQKQAGTSSMLGMMGCS
jgi:hypothetical protein